MSNPNSKPKRFARWLLNRWSQEDHPGGAANFKILLFLMDVGTYVLLPLIAIIIYRGCTGTSISKKSQSKVKEMRIDASKSQIIDFKLPNSGSFLEGTAKKAAGTLVKVKLLNVVETYSTAPVHVQILDNGLGSNLRGGVIIGDATPDTNFERINISFRLVRDPNREAVAFSLSGRALGLDGTLGLEATKKQDFVARATIDSAGRLEKPRGGSDAGDFKDILFKALTAGLLQEFGSKTQIEKNRAEVLTLEPSTVFFVELMDTFTGGQK